MPDFGSSPASLLIVGLAPAAHGANRTGRMFTGDDSGKWLYRALFRAGFAATDGYQTANDNQLRDAVITAIAHCAPPDNKPNPKEIKNCQPFLERSMKEVDAKIILALGSLAWKSSLETMEVVWDCGIPKPRPKFSHAAKVKLKDRDGQIRYLVGSYHPSRQNTNTGRLTEPMLDSVFQLVRNLLERNESL